ncbi:MAG: tautomerase family protein [Actinomycetota bacterium]
MPTIRYQLVQGLHTDEQIRDLLTRSCVLFADTLGVPADRIRAFADEVRPQAAAIGGELVSEGAAEAPFFEFMLFAGRPVEHGQQLMAGFTDLLVECLGSDRSRIRGSVRFVDPDHWSIGGVPASVVRRADIEARARAAQQGD